MTDDSTLVSAQTRFGNDIPVYDDGYGPIWIMRNSMGIQGIVRAKTWEEAYSICEDEFMDEADETVEELKKEYNTRQEHRRITNGRTGEFIRWDTIETPVLDTDEDAEYAWTNHPCFQESYGFRPNGANDRDKLKHGIYSKDLNGESLDVLTLGMLEDLEITLIIKTETEA